MTRRPQPDIPELNREALERSMKLGAALLSSWTRDGTLVDLAGAASMWGCSPKEMEDARRRDDIFSVFVDGQHWYPAEALKVDRKHLAVINWTLGDTEPTGKLFFFMREHGALRGLKPADAVKAGMVDEVLQVALAWSIA